MSQYILSEEAQSSLREIKKYSENKFGKKQTPLYLKSLDNRMEYLSKYPKHGVKRGEVKKGYYSFFEGSHTIYYLIKKDHIAIIDVLYQSIEPKLHIN